MGMIFEIGVAPGHINVCATGEFSLADARRTFLELMDAVVTHKVDKVLVDGRQLAGEPRDMERFYYGEFAAQEVKRALGVSSWDTKFAYVLVEPVLDPGRFGENVAVNRGMNVKAFDNPEDACRWLGLARS